MKINNKDLTESEKAKVEKMLCPKCNDGLREETVNGKKMLVCVNYYCRWEIRIEEDEPE